MKLLAVHIVRRGLSNEDVDECIFTMPEGGPLDYAHGRMRYWIPATKAVGLPWMTFHDLRRANATALVSAGVDLKTAQTRLGHSDPRLTLAVYAQATTAADRDAAERVAELLMKQSDNASETVTDETACATNVTRNRRRYRRPDPHKPSTSGFPGREGGIRTRGLSVPNAAR
jgi:hypothetical protein